MLRKLALPPVALGLVVATTGWFYAFRPGGLPGPRIADALPLDELAKHSGAPLLWFAAVWASAAVLLGLAARWAKVERLTAALACGAMTAVALYLVDGMSIAVTRQVSIRDALHVSMRLSSVYLPAALVGVAVGLIGQERRHGRRSPLLVSSCVAFSGALELLHTILPGDDTGLLRSLTPDAVGPLTRAAGAFAGLALLFAARGLARRRRRAWQLALAVAVLSTTLHILHGVSHGTLVSVVVLILLVARRQDFSLPGDEQTRYLLATRGLIAVATIGGYGLAALWLNQVEADKPFTLAFAGREILEGSLGLYARGSPHLAGSFGQWFPLSLVILGSSATVWIVSGWLAPWRHRARQEIQDYERALELVRTWGSDTLAPFVLRRDKFYFFAANRRAFVAYRVVGGVAIVSGDPIGPPATFGTLIAGFVEHARERDWRIAILGVSERWLGLYRAHGLNVLYHGDEAVVETAGFSLEGRAIRKVRQSVHRLEAAGCTVRVLRPSDLDSRLRAELTEIADSWRAGQPERGFVMALDALFSLGDDDAVFVIGLDGAGRPQGFLHFAVAHAISALSLSSMPRVRRATPNGFNEWLICESVAWARENGFERVSLNFSPFAALLAPEAELTGLQELERRALLRLKGHFQLDNLLAFNSKFFPRWERRFIVYERRRDLPRVGLAALAAEAYLPFQTARK